MAINPSTLPGYNGQTAAPDANYIYGSARDDAAPGDLTGTPRIAAEINDNFGFSQAALVEAGIVPTGTPDKVGASQVLDSIKQIVNINSLSVSFTFKNVTLMKASLIIFPVGKKIFWQGYHVESDGGSNWGIVKTGGHTDDGGSIFTLNNGDFVQANLKGKAVSILKFGAIGDWDGTTGTDNTTAVQGAIDFAPEGSSVHIPDGYFSFTTVSNINAVRIIGTGFNCEVRDVQGGADWTDTTLFSGSVLITTSGTGFGIHLGETARKQSFQLEDFMIIGEGVNTTRGIELERGGGSYIKNVLAGNLGIGFDIDSCQDSTFIKCSDRACDIGMQFGGATTSNQTVLHNCEHQDWTTYGVNLVAAALFCQYGGLYQAGRGGYGLKISATSSKSLVSGTWFENFNSLGCLGAIETFGLRGKFIDCQMSGDVNGIFLRSGADRNRFESVFFQPQTSPNIVMTMDAGSSNTTITDSPLNTDNSIVDNGDDTIETLFESDGGRGTTGSVAQIKGSSSVAGSHTIGGLKSGIATTEKRINQILNVPNATSTAVFTISVPNDTHSALLQIKLCGTLGAGGAEGEAESTAILTQDIAITRVAGQGLVLTQSGDALTAVAIVGAGEVVVPEINTVISGGATASQAITLRCKLSRGAGTSTNHTLTVVGELVSVNAGIDFVSL